MPQLKQFDSSAILLVILILSHVTEGFQSQQYPVNGRFGVLQPTSQLYEIELPSRNQLFNKSNCFDDGIDCKIFFISHSASLYQTDCFVNIRALN